MVGRPLKIGIVTEYYYPTLGGIQEHVYHFSKEVASRGHVVHIITSNVIGADLSYDVYNKGVKVIRVGYSLPIISNNSIGRVSLAPNISSKVKDILNHERYDVLHIHSPLHPVLPILALSKSNTLTIGTFHTNFDRSIFFTIFKPLLKMGIDRLDGLIAVSETAITTIKNYLNPTKEFRIIPNGVDTEMFSPFVPKIQSLNDNKINLLFVGRMEPRNGLDRLLKAFFYVREKGYENVRVIAIGDGPLRKIYEEMVPARLKTDVIFTGALNGGRPEYYSSSHILCFPATIASFGITLLEGCASGLPFVSTKGAGFPSIFKDGENGFMIDTSDERVFGETLIKLIKDENLRRRLGENGRRLAEKYSWKNITTQILDYYYELIQNRVC
ncbi:MAG: glycosyltransferase family 4 protein [Deltaproteobacteria bacterium]|nr:glycosyltransferase family 4 protein [Deltaproteobacteria bacterium]